VTANCKSVLKKGLLQILVISRMMLFRLIILVGAEIGDTVVVKRRRNGIPDENQPRKRPDFSRSNRRKVFTGGAGGCTFTQRYYILFGVDLTCISQSWCWDENHLEESTSKNSVSSNSQNGLSKSSTFTKQSSDSNCMWFFIKYRNYSARTS
jgi:hypothetical protein